MSDIRVLMSSVMADLGAITKDQEAKFGDRYKFRGIDDVYNALQPVLVKHGVVVTPELLSFSSMPYETKNGATMQRFVIQVRYTFHAPDGTTITATVAGEGADSADKAMNKAFSSAFKTAAFQSLCIPTQEQSDSEFDNPEPEAPRRKQAARKKAAGKKTEPASPAVRLFERMCTHVAGQGADPDVYAAGALNHILTQLGIDKTKGADLLAREDAIRDAIDEWRPPTGTMDEGPFLADDVKEMRGLHAWAMEEFGLDSERAHAALHGALPYAVDGLASLALSGVPALRSAMRAAHGSQEEGTV